MKSNRAIRRQAHFQRAVNRQLMVTQNRFHDVHRIQHHEQQQEAKHYKMMSIWMKEWTKMNEAMFL